MKALNRLADLSMLIPKGPGAFRMTLGRALREKCIEASHGLAELEAIGRSHLEAVGSAVPVEGHPSMTQFDARHQYRLSIVLQGLLASIYSAADIAAFLTNYVLQAAGHAGGPPPTSFNSLKKKLREGRLPELATALGDLGWHDRFHAMRTEWTHYSGVHVAGSVDSGISFCGGGFRRKSDQTVVEGRFSLGLGDLDSIVRGCIETLSSLAQWLLPVAVGIHDLEHVITVPEYDEKGLPRQRADFTFIVRQITVRQHLIERGDEEYLQVSADGVPETDRVEEGAPSEIS